MIFHIHEPVGSDLALATVASDNDAAHLVDDQLELFTSLVAVKQLPADGDRENCLYIVGENTRGGKKKIT